MHSKSSTSSSQPDSQQISRSFPTSPEDFTMLFSARKGSCIVNLSVLIFLSIQIIKVNTLGYCSRNIYSNPRRQSCEIALSTLPRDPFVRFFVEQQLRPSPGENWLAFGDPRRPEDQQKRVQVPKWWSAGMHLLLSIFRAEILPFIELELPLSIDWCAKDRATSRFRVMSIQTQGLRPRHLSGPVCLMRDYNSSWSVSFPMV